jgi:hypothetical protein
MTHLTGSSCSSNYETYLQEQLDLARWEGEGGAAAQHVQQARAIREPVKWPQLARYSGSFAFAS